MNAAFLLYEAALVLLAISFVLEALILRRLLALIQKRVLWVLPLVGALFLLCSAWLYGVSAVVLTPMMGADPEMYRESLNLRSASIVCLLLCGALGTFSGWSYYRRMGE